MKKESPIILLQSKIALDERKEEKSLAKRFFPSYLTKVKYLIHAIHKIDPKIAYKCTAKLLSVAGHKKLSKNAVVFYKKGVKRKIKVEGATFHTYTYGNGPLILLLHGWYSNGARWRVYVKELVDAGYKVMVVDAPGHGTAPGWFLSFFLYAKGIKKILTAQSQCHTIVTHSIAGLTAMAAIANVDKKQHPSKFIMMNTFANATTVLEKFACCLGISNTIIKGTKKQLSNQLVFPLKEFSICKQINRCSVKSLLIYDTKDSVVPREEAEYILDNTEALEVMKTEGLGHNLKSKYVVNAVVDFVKKGSNNTLQLKDAHKEIAAFV